MPSPRSRRPPGVGPGRRAAAKAAPGRETADIHFRVAKILATEGAAARDVEAHYLAALESDPTHIEALEALEAVARAAKNQGQLVQILELRERLTTDDVKKQALLAEMATLFSALGEAAEAIAPLERLAALLPGDPGVQEDLGKALVAAGRVEEGERVLTGLVGQMSKARQNKNVARLQQVLGSLAETRGDVALADQRLTAAYQLDPAQPATLAALGRLALRRNDAEKARRYYRSLLLQTFDEAAVGVTKAEVYLILGRLHLAAGELPKARNMFERGLEGAPDNGALKQALAELPRG